MRIRNIKIDVLSLGLSEERQLKVMLWSVGGEGGIPGVAAKCEKIRRNTSGEGDLQDNN